MQKWNWTDFRAFQWRHHCFGWVYMEKDSFFFLKKRCWLGNWGMNSLNTSKDLPVHSHKVDESFRTHTKVFCVLTHLAQASGVEHLIHHPLTCLLCNPYSINMSQNNFSFLRAMLLICSHRHSSYLLLEEWHHSWVLTTASTYTNPALPWGNIYLGH